MDSLVDQEHLEQLYGPKASHSEHQVSDVITYRDIETGETKTGKLVWICALSTIGERVIGVTYVVDPPGGSWQDMVFPSDVLTSA
jgi:hypothetical protein